MKEKLENANVIVKDYISRHFVEKSLEYIDYVKSDRFLYEIRQDKEISIQDSTSEDLAEYAIEKITSNASVRNLLGF